MLSNKYYVPTSQASHIFLFFLINTISPFQPMMTNKFCGFLFHSIGISHRQDSSKVWLTQFWESLFKVLILMKLQQRKYNSMHTIDDNWDVCSNLYVEKKSVLVTYQWVSLKEIHDEFCLLCIDPMASHFGVASIWSTLKPVCFVASLVCSKPVSPSRRKSLLTDRTSIVDEWWQ